MKQTEVQLLFRPEWADRAKRRRSRRLGKRVRFQDTGIDKLSKSVGDSSGRFSPSFTGIFRRRDRRDQTLVGG